MVALDMEMPGPLGVKSLLRLVRSRQLLKFLQMFKVETRRLLVHTTDIVVMDFSETAATA